MKVFQLRAARSVTGIGVRDVGLYLGISRTIISRWENQPILNEIKTKRTSLKSLTFFFKQHNILFPDKHSVQLIPKVKQVNSIHLNRFQFRASRAALNLTQKQLAELTHSYRATVNYFEIQENECLLNTTKKIVDDMKFKDFFEKNGISFPDNLTIKLSSTNLKS